MALSGAKIDRDQAWLYADVQFAADLMNDAGQNRNCRCSGSEACLGHIFVKGSQIAASTMILVE